MNEEDDEEWQQHYAFLSKSQLTDPMNALGHLTKWDTLWRDRYYLFEYFYGALGSGKFQDFDEQEMQDRLFFFDRILDILEAAHRLGELYERKLLQYSYLGDTSPK
jgi:hypothetical protein